MQILIKTENFTLYFIAEGFQVSPKSLSSDSQVSFFQFSAIHHQTERIWAQFTQVFSLSLVVISIFWIS